MYNQLLLSLGLLASLSECAPTQPKTFSMKARRQAGLTRRAGTSAPATKKVVVDFTFGGQKIPCSVDTGSPFTWLASTLVPQSELTGLPAVYKPTGATYHELAPYNPKGCGVWPSSTATCNMGGDDVSAGGVTAKNMTFGVAHTMGKDVFASGQAGTVGLSRNSGDPSSKLLRNFPKSTSASNNVAEWSSDVTPFWYKVGPQLAAPYLFTADLYADKDGSFEFGYIDPKKYSGEIAYAKVDTGFGFWNFNLSGSWTMGKTAGTKIQPFRVLFDSGGPNIGLPADIVKPYFASFGGKPSSGNSHTYPCSAYPPPDLTLDLADGGKMVLDGKFLVEPPSGSGTTCNGRIDDSVQTGYNLGASVLDQKFVVFDHAKQRIGIANKASAKPSSANANAAPKSTTVHTATAATAKPANSPTPAGTGAHTSTTAPCHGMADAE